MKKLMLLLCLILLIGCKETIVEPYNLGDDNLGIKSITTKKYNRQNEDKVLVGHYLEEYNKKGLLINRIEYNLMEEGKIYSKHERVYDDNDNILNSQTYTNGELEWERIFTYKNKKIHKEESYHNDELVHTTTYEYKKNYRKTTFSDLINDTKQVNERVYNDDGSYTIEYERIDSEGLNKGVFEMNSENQMLESSSSDNENSTESATFEYDDKGNRIKAISIKSNGEENVSSLEYDEYNNLIRYENSGNTEWVLEYIYEYDDKGNYISKMDKTFGEISRYEEREINYWD
ncbi:MAG: hypothetical protein JEZ08_04360 [Clostridiales bacterium]|nr:hypothetical protein [Clostridiales bacterium]